MVPKLNANIKFKLSLGWFKYVDIKSLDNNKVQQTKTLSHTTPPNNTLFDIGSRKINT